MEDRGFNVKQCLLHPLCRQDVSRAIRDRTNLRFVCIAGACHSFSSKVLDIAGNASLFFVVNKFTRKVNFTPHIIFLVGRAFHIKICYVERPRCFLTATSFASLIIENNENVL
jgi:hypothetical protein